MKNLLFLVIISLILAGIVIGCQKNSSSSQASKPTLTISKSTVARGEQLTMAVNNLPASAAIKWALVPSPGTKLLTGKDQATAFFGNSGSYKLTANFYADSSATVPYDSSSTPVTVSDSVYTPPVVILGDTLSLQGDQVMIEPIFASDSAGLYMMVQTVKLYDCYPQLMYSFTESSNTMTLNCIEVTSSLPLVDCGGAMNTAQAFFSTSIGGGSAANGVYAFNVILNNTTYQGTLTITNGSYTFGWNYASGVTISPLQVSRQ